MITSVLWHSAHPVHRHELSSLVYPTMIDASAFGLCPGEENNSPRRTVSQNLEQLSVKLDREKIRACVRRVLAQSLTERFSKLQHQRITRYSSLINIPLVIGICRVRIIIKIKLQPVKGQTCKISQLPHSSPVVS